MEKIVNAIFYSLDEINEYESPEARQWYFGQVQGLLLAAYNLNLIEHADFVFWTCDDTCK